MSLNKGCGFMFIVMNTVIDETFEMLKNILQKNQALIKVFGEERSKTMLKEKSGNDFKIMFEMKNIDKY